MARIPPIVGRAALLELVGHIGDDGLPFVQDADRSVALDLEAVKVVGAGRQFERTVLDTDMAVGGRRQASRLPALDTHVAETC